jgi:hypothetical protein
MIPILMAGAFTTVTFFAVNDAAGSSTPQPDILWDIGHLHQIGDSDGHAAGSRYETATATRWRHSVFSSGVDISRSKRFYYE